MASDNKIQIEIEVNGERALATLNLTEENIKNLGASFNQAKRSTTDFSSSAVMGLQDVRNVVQGLEGIWRTFNATFNQSFALYERQINAEQRLEAVLRASGREVEQNSARLREYASALQQATTFGDEAILEAQGILLTFQNIGLEVLPRVTEAALDMASVFGGDAAGSARQLARALDDPARGLDTLRRSGVAFSREQEDQIKTLAESGRIMEAQAVILEELEGRFQGTARAIANTPAGRFRQLQNELGDLREEAGALMATGIGPVVSGLTSIIRTSNDISPVIGGLVSLTGGLTAAYIALNVTGLTPLLRTMVTWKPAVSALPAQTAAATAGVGGLTLSFRAATVAARGFFASLGPIGWAALGISALVPIIGLFSSKSREAAESTSRLDTALRDLTLDQKREKLRELANEIQALQRVVRNASDANWRREQLATLGELEQQYRALANAALMQDADQLELEIAGQGLVLNRLNRDLAEARRRLLAARGRENREAALEQVRDLISQTEALQALISRYEDQLALLRERARQQQNDQPAALTPDQQRQIEQLRIAVIADAQQQELAQLDLWYRQQLEIAAGSQENLLLLEQAYTERQAAIRQQYRARELSSQRQFEERLEGIAMEFRRLAGDSEIRILNERLEQLESALQAEEQGGERYQQIYLSVLQTRLDIAREQKRIDEQQEQDDTLRAERRLALLREIARQELELFEATERLELSRATRELPFEERRLAELALEQNLLLNRQNLLNQELDAVRENAELTVEERQRQTNAILIELLRIEQGLEDVGSAALAIEGSFAQGFGSITGYANQVLGTMQNLFGNLNQLYQQDARRKIDSETRKRNAAIDTAEREALAAATSAEERSAIEQAYEQRREALEEEMQQKKAEAARKFFTLQQVASVGQATMNTYEAATKALTAGPILGPILAGLITAAGLANIAVIATQQPPAFAQGGLFRGRGGPEDDANVALLSDGEYIVNAASTRRYLPLLEAINTDAGLNRPLITQQASVIPGENPNQFNQEMRQFINTAGKILSRPPVVQATALISDYQSAAILRKAAQKISTQTLNPFPN